MPRLTLLILLFVGMIGHAQSEKVTNVNRDIDVALVYEQVVKEGYGTPAVYLKLANAYYFESRYEDAKKWFETLFEEEKTTDKMVLFRYKQSLKALKLDYQDNPYLLAN